MYLNIYFKGGPFVLLVYSAEYKVSYFTTFNRSRNVLNTFFFKLIHIVIRHIYNSKHTIIIIQVV